MNYSAIIDEMRTHADEPGRTHLLRLQQTLYRVAPELMPHIFWERIPAICNYYYSDNTKIRAIFQKAAEREMKKQRMSI